MSKRPVIVGITLCAIILAHAHTAAAQQPQRAVTTDAALFNLQQSNVPPAARQVEQEIEETVERFRIGVIGGVGLDPELVAFGAHAAFAPVFHRNVELRPGVEFGLGEVTTVFAINVDVLYRLPGTTARTRWMPYIGLGPTFGLSHRGFETDEDDDRNRFDFSDTDFNGGLNFVAGARNQSGLFFELRTTAYGVSNVRLLAGFNF